MAEYTINQVAKQLGLHAFTIRRWIARGVIVPARVEVVTQHVAYFDENAMDKMARWANDLSKVAEDRKAGKPVSYPASIPRASSTKEELPMCSLTKKQISELKLVASFREPLTDVTNPPERLFKGTEAFKHPPFPTPRPKANRTPNLIEEWIVGGPGDPPPPGWEPGDPIPPEILPVPVIRSPGEPIPVLEPAPVPPPPVVPTTVDGLVEHLLPMLNHVQQRALPRYVARMRREKEPESIIYDALMLWKKDLDDEADEYDPDDFAEEPEAIDE